MVGGKSSPFDWYARMLRGVMPTVSASSVTVMPSRVTSFPHASRAASRPLAGPARAPAAGPGSRRYRCPVGRRRCDERVRGPGRRPPSMPDVQDVPPSLRERARAHLDAGAAASVAPTRDASTVVLLRDGATGPEVYLLRRAGTMAFAAGM